MILNYGDFQSTNSIHRIYFKRKLSQIEKKWLQVSLLSTPSQLSVEYYSRIYGGGVLKIEPGALSKTIAFICDDKCITNIYKKIASYVKNDRLEAASELATNFIFNFLKISNKLKKETTNALSELRTQRQLRQKSNL